MQVGDVEAPDAAARGVVLGHVAGVAAHALVAARAERERALAGEHDDADLEVLAGALEGVGQISITVCGRKALRTSGRSIVILAIPSATS